MNQFAIVYCTPIYWRWHCLESNTKLAQSLLIRRGQKFYIRSGCLGKRSLQYYVCGNSTSTSQSNSGRCTAHSLCKQYYGYTTDFKYATTDFGYLTMGGVDGVNGMSLPTCAKQIEFRLPFLADWVGMISAFQGTDFAMDDDTVMTVISNWMQAFLTVVIMVLFI